MAQALEIRFAREADEALVSSILVEAATWIASAGQPLWPIDQLSAEAIAPDVGAGSFILASVDTVGVATRASRRMIPSAGRMQSLAWQFTCTGLPFAEPGLDGAWRA